MFSETGNILCGKSFPRSDNIRFVDRMIYSQDFNGANPDELDVMPSKGDYTLLFITFPRTSSFILNSQFQLLTANNCTWT